VLGETIVVVSLFYEQNEQTRQRDYETTDQKKQSPTGRDHGAFAIGKIVVWRVGDLRHHDAVGGAAAEVAGEQGSQVAAGTSVAA